MIKMNYDLFTVYDAVNQKGTKRMLLRIRTSVPPNISDGHV